MEKWNDIKNKIAFEQAKAKAKQFGKDVVEAGKKTVTWIKDNPIAASILMATGGSLLREGNKMMKNASEAKRRYDAEREFYDYSSKRYLKLKRKPTDWENYEANRRHLESGDSYSKIYRDMGLL